ncbi:MAG: tetratricopeptide repeat protein, partial [Planctomycetes bacterium]|nr:tetratricopeptide repeat protein [Planctomycetota bacterium]
MSLRVLAMLATVLLAGCAELKKNPARQEAQARWEQMRAKVKLQLAERNFDSGQIEDALKLDQEVLALDPNSLGGYLLMARIRLERGQTAEAEAALDAAAGLGRAVPELDYLRGMLAERREQRSDAVSWYKRAYDAQTNEADYLLAYVEAMLAAEDTAPALELLRKRERDFEQDVRVQLLFGRTLVLLGRHRESSDAYLSVIRLAPNAALLREETGLALLAAGRASEAQAVLEPLLDLPNVKPSTPALEALASALVQMNQPQRAIDVLEDAAGSEPRSFAACLLLGKAYLLANRAPAARQAARQACDLKPESAQARLLLACCALAAGDRDEAIAAAQDLIAADP